MEHAVKVREDGGVRGVVAVCAHRHPRRCPQPLALDVGRIDARHEQRRAELGWDRLRQDVGRLRVEGEHAMGTEPRRQPNVGDLAERHGAGLELGRAVGIHRCAGKRPGCTPGRCE